MATVLISHSKGCGFCSKWDGELSSWLLQGIHKGKFSFFQVTQAAGRIWPVVMQGSAEAKRGCGFSQPLFWAVQRGQCPWVLVGSALPSDQEPSPRAAPRCPLGPERPCRLGLNPVPGHPPKELQKVSSCVRKKNKCGICHCLVCVLV